MSNGTLETTLNDDREVIVEYTIEPADRDVGIMSEYVIVDRIVFGGKDVTTEIDEGELLGIEERCSDAASERHNDYDDYGGEEL